MIIAYTSVLDTEAPSEMEKDKDIIFLLDISNSMENPLGSSTRLDKMKETVNGAIDILTQNDGIGCLFIF
jgi:hypothetical protein